MVAMKSFVIDSGDMADQQVCTHLPSNLCWICHVSSAPAGSGLDCVTVSSFKDHTQHMPMPYARSRSSQKHKIGGPCGYGGDCDPCSLRPLAKTSISTGANLDDIPSNRGLKAPSSFFSLMTYLLRKGRVVNVENRLRTQPDDRVPS